MAGVQWKAVERAIAALLGGVRVPVTGRGRGSAPDIAHPCLALEVKHRRSIPAWIHDAVAQARAANDGTKANVVILHQFRRPYEESYVLMPLADLRELIGAE